MDTENLPQILSFSGVGLFTVMVLVIVVGTLRPLSLRQIRFVAFLGFTSCGLLSVVTSALYFWHWRGR